ncbi:hypothetical protein E4U41_000857 [Claviceps citrina]|nr:hypothetical protein E4U41_000857 [Claviceps citrina]
MEFRVQAMQPSARLSCRATHVPPPVRRRSSEMDLPRRIISRPTIKEETVSTFHIPSSPWNDILEAGAAMMGGDA